MRRITKDAVFDGHVSRIEVLIDQYGMCNAMAAMLQAVENIQDDNEEKEDYENSQTYNNLEHVREVIESAMSAVDLHIRHDSMQHRLEKMEYFKDEMKKIGVA